MTPFLSTINNYTCEHPHLININIGKYVMFCLLFLLNGCSQVEELAQVKFNVSYENQELSCDVSFKHLNKQWELQQLQFFISDISLKNKQGNWHSWLMKKNNHQSHNVALIGEQCGDIKSTFNEWGIALSEQVNIHDFSAIKFTLGVPFALNHLNPLTQPSPLNDSSMFWVWQTGHKFLRLELKNADENWLFHLGSTGCKAPSAVRSPRNECLYPNRVEVELTLPTQQKNKQSDSEQSIKQQAIKSFDVNIDLAKLLNGLALNRNTFCQSSSTNEYCKPLFSSLGLDKNKTDVFEIKIND